MRTVGVLWAALLLIQFADTVHCNYGNLANNGIVTTNEINTTTSESVVEEETSVVEEDVITTQNNGRVISSTSSSAAAATAASSTSSSEKYLGQSYRSPHGHSGLIIEEDAESSSSATAASVSSSSVSSNVGSSNTGTSTASTALHGHKGTSYQQKRNNPPGLLIDVVDNSATTASSASAASSSSSDKRNSQGHSSSSSSAATAASSAGSSSSASASATATGVSGYRYIYPDRLYPVGIQPIYESDTAAAAAAAAASSSSSDGSSTSSASASESSTNYIVPDRTYSHGVQPLYGCDSDAAAASTTANSSGGSSAASAAAASNSGRGSSAASATTSSSSGGKSSAASASSASSSGNSGSSSASASSATSSNSINYIVPNRKYPRGIQPIYACDTDAASAAAAATSASSGSSTASASSASGGDSSSAATAAASSDAGSSSASASSSSSSSRNIVPNRTYRHGIQPIYACDADAASAAAASSATSTSSGGGSSASSASSASSSDGGSSAATAASASSGSGSGASSSSATVSSSKHNKHHKPKQCENDDERPPCGCNCGNCDCCGHHKKKKHHNRAPPDLCENHPPIPTPTPNPVPVPVCLPIPRPFSPDPCNDDTVCPEEPIPAPSPLPVCPHIPRCPPDPVPPPGHHYLRCPPDPCDDSPSEPPVLPYQCNDNDDPLPEQVCEPIPRCPPDPCDNDDEPSLPPSPPTGGCFPIYQSPPIIPFSSSSSVSNSNSYGGSSSASASSSTSSGPRNYLPFYSLPPIPNYGNSNGASASATASNGFGSSTSAAASSSSSPSSYVPVYGGGPSIIPYYNAPVSSSAAAASASNNNNGYGSSSSAASSSPSSGFGPVLYPYYQTTNNPSSSSSASSSSSTSGGGSSGASASSSSSSNPSLLLQSPIQQIIKTISGPNILGDIGGFSSHIIKHYVQYRQLIVRIFTQLRAKQIISITAERANAILAQLDWAIKVIQSGQISSISDIFKFIQYPAEKASYIINIILIVFDEIRDCEANQILPQGHIGIIENIVKHSRLYRRLITRIIQRLRNANLVQIPDNLITFILSQLNQVFEKIESGQIKSINDLLAGIVGQVPQATFVVKIVIELLQVLSDAGGAISGLGNSGLPVLPYYSAYSPGSQQQPPCYSNYPYGSAAASASASLNGYGSSSTAAATSSSTPYPSPVPSYPIYSSPPQQQDQQQGTNTISGFINSIPANVLEHYPQYRHLIKLILNRLRENGLATFTKSQISSNLSEVDQLIQSIQSGVITYSNGRFICPPQTSFVALITLTILEEVSNYIDAIIFPLGSGTGNVVDNVLKHSRLFRHFTTRITVRMRDEHHAEFSEKAAREVLVQLKQFYDSMDSGQITSYSDFLRVINWQSPQSPFITRVLGTVFQVLSSENEGNSGDTGDDCNAPLLPPPSPPPSQCGEYPLKPVTICRTYYPQSPIGRYVQVPCDECDEPEANA